MIDGLLEVRGEEAFEKELSEVIRELGEVNLTTSRNEIHEAIKDLSKRPKADITGSVQHSVAALECVCREVTGDRNMTLGALIKNIQT